MRGADGPQRGRDGAGASTGHGGPCPVTAHSCHLAWVTLGLGGGVLEGLGSTGWGTARPLTPCSLPSGVETKAVLPKKEKLKLRRERWLHKIEAIKLAEQKRKAERRRQATVVVGDLQPLRDALPELLELEAGGRRLPARRGAASRPRPAELSRMNAAQRLQLLEEERTRFQELLASPAYRASPLLAIGRQLAQQMQLDGSQP
ncbi:Protein FAM207A [Camelus dromedarius]|uniref:Protein FAM207A n=1 Tax=Camelus dromedarius TaxID=9838 RepID=A0A5N4EJP8_CAMDR|nr:Protein FAM207A [Camelus dromedarius]